MKDTNYEILAPAGSVEQLLAAVNNGCDAVYLGLDAFNARMKAPNFTVQNLRRWVDFCHFFGVRVYVTVNTSVKNEELQAAANAVRTAYDCLTDGVIVTDLWLMRYAVSLPKPFSVVASTQLNVHDKYGAQFIKALGADTVVCSRECSYEQIAEIASVGLKVECFLHGALCVCQSGQCLFSSIVGGNSGNRGLCAQPCRKMYKSNVGKFQDGGYLLSAKDICGLDTAKKLLDCGVTTFKIEGRNRRPEYAGATARVYSELFQNGFSYDKNQFDLLAEMFNRGNLPPCGYLSGNNGEIIYPYVQNHVGVEVGTIKNGRVATLQTLRKGDGLKIFNGNKEFCGGVVLESGTGSVRVQFSDSVKDGMKVFRTTSQQLCSDVLETKRKLPLNVELSAFCGKKCLLTLSAGDISVTMQSAEILPKAVKCATNRDEFVVQLSKLGDFPFLPESIVVNCDEVFMAKSQINALRRDGIEQLQKAIIENYNSRFISRNSFQAKTKTINKTASKSCLAVVCYDKQQVREVSKLVDYVIYKPKNLINLAGLPDNCYVDLPPFANCHYLQSLLERGKFGIVCNNVGQVQFARQFGLRYIGGIGLNLFNDQIVQEFGDADTFVYSLELTLREIQNFNNNCGIVFVDGKLPLMKVIHCPYKLAFGCSCATCKGNEALIYTDEFGNEFEFMRRKDAECSFELFNGKQLYVADKLFSAGRYCIDYDKNAIRHFVNLNSGVMDNYVCHGEYTRGRLFRKVN